MTRENIVKQPSGRVQRTRVGARNRLAVDGKEAGYVYRFVNDTEDRVAMFKQAGYEIVPAGNVSIGNQRVDAASSDGSNAHVSVGGGTKAFLMRQREDWYKEDQADKQKQVSETESATIRDAKNGPGRYGSIEISRIP